jgi:predicted enzyme related to lactoylglutathione lyase
MIKRRNFLHRGVAIVAAPWTAILQAGCSSKQVEDKTNTMKIHYLEIVTPDVETICTLYSKMYGVTFGDADQNLGGARTARLANGGMLGVRAPMHAGEQPVVRPYILVDDIEAAVAMAAKSGAEIAVPPMKLPGHGTCAIFIQSGIESGLWQV